MAMNGKVFVVLLIVAIVLISGCVQKKAPTQEQVQKIFVGGKDGLVASFLQGQPPKDTFVRSPFSIGIQLQNKGETDVAEKTANVYLGGISSDSFGIYACFPNPADDALNAQTECPKKTDKATCYALDSDNDQTSDCVWQPYNSDVNKQNLTGTKLVGTQTVPGGQEIVSFESQGYQTDVPGTLEFTAAATVCYPYTTKAVALACLSQDLLAQTVGKEICKISGEKNPSSTGAPIKVTSAVELPLGKNRVGFQIKIKDVGVGDAYKLGIADCRTVKTADLDYVKVKSAKVGNIELSCSPTALILAENEEGQTFCQGDVSGIAGLVQELLTIELEYKYMSQISQKFNVKPT